MVIVIEVIAVVATHAAAITLLFTLNFGKQTLV
jgi:hypothetical protein